MTTEAQINANRANAQKSTGPRTPEGKAVVAQNALKHGFWSQEVVIKGEDAEEFALFRAGLLEELAPAGLMELILAQRIVSLSWRLQRAERLQITAFEKVDQKDEPQPVMSQEDAGWILAKAVERGISFAKPNPEGPVFGRKAVKDFDQERALDRLLMYERRIEHSLYRTMAELRKLRKEGGVVNGQTSVKFEVPGLKSEDEAAIPPASDFPLDIVVEPPGGTKPICGDSDDGRVLEVETTEEVGRGRPTHEETPDGVTTNVAAAEGPFCGTKPISEEVSSVECQVSSEQGQAANVPSLPTSNLKLETAVQPPSCETKPISARRIKDNEGYRPYYRRRR